MMRGLLILSLILPLAAQAQDSYAQRELRQELNRSPKTIQKVQVAPAPAAAPSNLSDGEYPLKSNPADASAQGSQATSVVNFNSNMYQQQPPMMVEENPVSESAANLLRKKRQSVEEQTETKIVEHLEAERIKAEERRAKKILGNIASADEGAAASAATSTNVNVTTAANGDASNAPVAVQVVSPTAQAAAAAAPVVAPAPVVETSSEKFEDIDETPKSARMFVGALGGVGDYPGVSNVHGIYALGFNLGVELPQRVIVEGSFLYSSYDIDRVDNPYYGMNGYRIVTEMDQMNFGAGVKYQILGGTVRPVVGALTSYTYRTYKDRIFGTVVDSSKITSSALDLGLSGGVDVALSNTFTLGLDLKYLFNLSYRTNSDFTYVIPFRKENPVETNSYYTLGLNGRVTF